ncbi:MAG TPA: alpha/beta hydrolase [Polyangiales bacterium]|nr:alpha/beta hydrolase [Polyangiales bacterium]
MVSVRDVTFESGGQRCAADLYWPDRAADALPCVVMAHGGSGTKRLGLPKYAQKFAERGMAVLVFDYRHFGASAGEPRQVIDIDEQRADYHAAIERARALPGIDPERIALWGTSLSGGHVLAVAARDARLAAVVSQVPMIDGWHRGRKLEQRLDRDVIRRTLQFTGAALRDVARARRRLPPYLVPVVARPGEVAVFTEPEAKATFEALGGEASGWRNQLAPRFLFALPRYEKGSAERIRMPLLICLADHDLQASSEFAARVAARARCVDIRHYPLGHFDVYLGAAIEEISRVQADFLSSHLFAVAPQAHRAEQRELGAGVSPT